MWEKLLHRYLTGHIRRGDLALIMPDGASLNFGDGQPPHVTAKIHNTDIVRRLVLNPELAVPEAYMEESLTIEGDDLNGLLVLALMNRSELLAQGAWHSRLEAAYRRLSGLAQQVNDMGRSKRHVAVHYDLSGELFSLFLDEDRQYSCAYFPKDGMSLEDAQRAK